MFLFLCPQYLTTEPMFLRYSVIIFRGGTKKALLTVSGWQGYAGWDVILLGGDYSGLMSPSNGSGLKPSP